MNSLFMEASAKTAIGVDETFREVVVNIINSPDLWATPADKAKGRPGVPTNATMPGTINIDDAPSDSNGADAGGCGC